MSKYQELQAKFDELQKDIRAIDSKDTYQAIFLLQESSNLIRELLKELQNSFSLEEFNDALREASNKEWGDLEEDEDE